MWVGGRFLLMELEGYYLLELKKEVSKSFQERDERNES